MNHYEQYKRMIKFLSSSVIVLLEVGIYWIVWNYYYNTIIEFPFFRRGNWLMVFLYGILLLFFMKTYGGFKIGTLKKGHIIYAQILSCFFVNVITYLQIALLDKKFHSMTVILWMTFAEVFCIIIWAFAFNWFYARLFPQRKLLLVYGDRPAFNLMEKINSREDKYLISGALNIEIGVESIMMAARNYEGVILGDVPAHDRNALMKRCFAEGIRTYTVPKISDILLRSSEELNIFDSPLFLSRNEGMHFEQRIVKRLIDIICAGVMLVATSPFFLLIAVSIKLTDGGPVFYKQKRLTKWRKTFDIYKFRTMIQDAEKMGAQLASENDPRILPVGRLLRATRLDELPQLINVLKGEMSMVGPRPERPELAEEIERDIPEFSYRLMVKAGLTGYAQIYGKYNTTSYDKLKLDLTYIRNYSVWLDLKLMIMTPKIMFMKESTEGFKNEDCQEEGIRQAAMSEER
ncbi:MAG: sugar transferase [bacterium]|nr:sugar transferase [bacterium]